jgi:hypothetical protein
LTATIEARQGDQVHAHYKATIDGMISDLDARSRERQLLEAKVG